MVQGELNQRIFIIIEEIPKCGQYMLDCLFFRHSISAVVLELTNNNVICAIDIFFAVLSKFSLVFKNSIDIIAFRS